MTILVVLAIFTAIFVGAALIDIKRASGPSRPHTAASRLIVGDIGPRNQAAEKREVRATRQLLAGFIDAATYSAKMSDLSHETTRPVGSPLGDDARG